MNSKSKEEIRIIFLGTPDFAVASLKAMVEEGYNVVAVVTAPDKPAGRGMQLKASAVKEYAVTCNIPVLQPERLKAPDFIETLKSYHADLQIVVAFRMLPEIVWSMPPMGTVNVHGSLLPQYRGAAPINWAIINGEPTTGVTTFKLQHEIDTGAILLQHAEPILAEDNMGTMYQKLMQAGAQLLVKTVADLIANIIVEQPQPQQDTTLKHAPKIFKEDCLIHWNQNAMAIHNLIRGLAPIPAAYTFLQEKQLKIFASTISIVDEPTIAIGTWDSDGKSYLRFKTVDGWLYVTDLQYEGKKRMLVADFLRGFRM